jgi:hypothetical protein
MFCLTSILHTYFDTRAPIRRSFLHIMSDVSIRLNYNALMILINLKEPRIITHLLRLFI